MASIINEALGLAKHIVFERGQLICTLNAPAFRKSIRAIRQKEKKDRLRVGFMIQCSQNWVTLLPIYEAALRDEKIEPVILLMPEMKYRMYVIQEAVLWQETYAFGEKEFPREACVRTYDPETDTWVDPKTLDLDYVFLPRPYETYLPKPYRASSLRKFCRVCYQVYGFSILNDSCVVYNSHFIRNVYMLFCEKQRSLDYVSRKLRRNLKSGDQKALLLGYAKFDQIESHRGHESDLWPRPRSKEITRVMWTPRWTNDIRLGGTSFFHYQQDMITYAETHPEIDLVFRPHPLALEHYVSEGLITREDLDAYLARYEACPNAVLDTTKKYFDTFCSSDILISDISSLLLDYLFTGNPLIYTKVSDRVVITLEGLEECMYTVRNFTELENTIAMIRSGNDPKRPLREELVRKLRRDGKNSEHILEAIRQDYYEEA